MFKNELLIDEIKDLENKISYVFKTVFLSFIKNKMKITSYLFFIKLTNCLPADCYSVQEKNVKVRVQEQEQVRVQERVQHTAGFHKRSGTIGAQWRETDIGCQSKPAPA